MITQRTEQRFGALESYLETVGDSGRWLVLTHDNPDPDALVSAVLLSALLRRRFGRRVTTAYGGIIGRSENQALFKSLRHGFSHLRHLSFRNYRHFALVDAQPGTGNSRLPEGVLPDLVFDHHPVRKLTSKVPFTDVRPEYGATVTILAEYIEHAGLRLTGTTATGLIYALRTETRDFGREFSPPDKAVYDAFLPKANKRLLSKIQNADLPQGYFQTLHQALEHLQAVDTLVVTHLGAVEQPDIVPEIADLLLRMQGKTWSLATGLHEGRIYLSMRTSNPRANAAKLMRRLVGRRGKGGGHGMIAGGWIPTDPLPEGAAIPTPAQNQLGRRLARYLKKNPERLTALELGQRASNNGQPERPEA